MVGIVGRLVALLALAVYCRSLALPPAFLANFVEIPTTYTNNNKHNAADEQNRIDAQDVAHVRIVASIANARTLDAGHAHRLRTHSNSYNIVLPLAAIQSGNMVANSG